MDIKNKVVIITGASMGIGYATAQLLAKSGAKLVLAARSVEKLEALGKQIPDSYVVPTDMTMPKEIENLVEATIKKFGRVDILINNAGQGIYGAVADVDVD